MRPYPPHRAHQARQAPQAPLKKASSSLHYWPTGSVTRNHTYPTKRVIPELGVTIQMQYAAPGMGSCS
ncbi:hypothetical protein M7I_3012 [Glarea lozoyensis 74030]|uniref:Uncharacterized protein n=1 Tax=Glarea lozoyensis (strain ATCC 74030 / MF5533) TaxID=1104152 RepID=H0EKB7_GLAL7|nr:hypothetical protein M7I_3012 [Glarea lozoyensis 74030]